ncbi:MAG: hypothetical protein ABI992_12230 [Chthoniobacterales bacterium]
MMQIVKAATRYQLVLQLPAVSLADYDALIAWETLIEGALDESADLDGHDIGAAEANIFVITSEPETTFRRLLPALRRSGWPEDAMAAYRDIAGERYRVLWPEHPIRDFIVA